MHILQNLACDTIPLRSSVVVLLRGDLLNLSGARRSSGIRGSRSRHSCSVEMGIESHVHDGPKWYEPA